MSGVQDIERAAFVRGYLAGAEDAEAPWDDGPRVDEDDALVAWARLTAGITVSWGEGIFSPFRPRRETLEEMVREGRSFAVLRWPG